MLFNSYIFILCFLPLTMLAYFGLNRLKKYRVAKLSLVIASLIFCGYSDIKAICASQINIWLLPGKRDGISTIRPSWVFPVVQWKCVADSAIKS